MDVIKDAIDRFVDKYEAFDGSELAGAFAEVINRHFCDEHKHFFMAELEKFVATGGGNHG